MRDVKPRTIDDYLAAVSADQRAALEKLRKTIRAAVPKAEECISYQLPAFRLDGRLLVLFGASANHCAFYPGSGTTVAAHAAALESYDTSKGAIRFQLDKPLPVALVRKLVKARITENEGSARQIGQAKARGRSRIMKTASMNVGAVMAQLEKWGSPSVRSLSARRGVGDKQFGVQLGKLCGLAKELKTDHALAMKLWATENVDAMILATMIMDPAQVSARDAERMIKPLTFFQLVDELVGHVLVRTPFAGQLRVKWMDSPKEMVGRAGWKLLCSRIARRETDGLDLDAILRRIEAEILSAPYRKQEAMNHCLVEIGVHLPHLTRKCIDLGERLGRFDKRPVPKGCVSTYAPEWIAAVLKRKKA